VSGRTASRTAWALCAVSLLATVVQAVLRLPHLGELAERYDPFLVFPIITLATLAASVVGALIVSRHPRHPVGWLFCVGNAFAEVGLAGAAWTQHSGLQDEPLPGQSYAAWVAGMTGSNFALGLLVLTLLLFPTGRLPSPRWRPVAWLAVVNFVVLEGLVAVVLGAPDGAQQLDPPALEGTRGVISDTTQYVLVVCLLLGFASVVGRRRRATGVERQQLRLFSLAAAAFAGSVVLLVLAGPLEALGLSRAVPETLFYLAYGGLPVAAGLAMLRYRLYDVDLVLNRAALLAALLTVTTLGYVAVVVAAGALLGDGIGSGTAVSIGATTLVAVAVQPARRRLRRFADTLVYGRRATPYEVLATFADRLGEALALDDVLPRTAEAAARGLGARSAYVRVLLEDGRSTGARWPQARRPGPPTWWCRWCTPGGPSGDRPGPATGRRAERARSGPAGRAGGPGGLALHNVRLTTQLQATLDELAASSTALSASRSRLVAASTTERQRLERRITAAVRPHLTAIAERLPAVGQVLDDGPRASALLEELAEQAVRALEALRDVARGVFPPVLADRGLLPALEAAAAASTTPVTVHAQGLPRLPACVELAAYFCCVDLLAAAAVAGAPVQCRLAVAGGELRIGLDVDVPLTAAVAAVEDRVAAVGGSVRRARECRPAST
jgi:signal transduction histidine kinase